MLKEIDDFYFNQNLKFEEGDTAEIFLNRINNNIKLGELDSCIFFRLDNISLSMNNFESYFPIYKRIQKIIKISNNLYKKIN